MFGAIAHLKRFFLLATSLVKNIIEGVIVMCLSKANILTA
jgi:hypothetical protein